MTAMNKLNFLQRIGRSITRIRNFVMNMLFLLVVAALIVVAVGSSDEVEVPEDAALVLNPEGQLVEDKRVRNPFEKFWQAAPGGQEVGINDLVRAVDQATEDDRIRLIVLDLEQLRGIASAHASYLGQALERFKAEGKEVVAHGYAYSQGQYAIASFADEVYMHPFGELLFEGYSRFLLYFKGLLEKFHVSTYVFRVGEYKEAAEPFTEKAMSPAAREVNQAMVNDLWSAYRRLILANRELTSDAFDRYSKEFPSVLSAAGGDMAKVALEYGLVDELMTVDDAMARIASKLGASDSEDYPHIHYEQYLKSLAPNPPTARNLGLIYARGVVVMGDERNAVAADNLVELIREARKDDSVAAIVIRIDSPGGSALASELIRQELELAQLAEKPVIASLGPVAASGGYWIASTADRIIAHPTTLTGSIGVIGLALTFEQTLADIGVDGDGVGSLPLSGAHPVLGLNKPMQQVIESSVEHVYDRFLKLVAKGRNMTPQAVDEVAQGRVWLGENALAIGLIDDLGGLPDAFKKAAEIANLGEDYGVKTFRPSVPLSELLLQEITNSMDARAVLASSQFAAIASVPIELRRAWSLVSAVQDGPQVHAICEACLDLLIAGKG